MISRIANYVLKGMEIYFSVDNNREIFKLPYVPPDVDFGSPLDSGTFETTSGKILTLVGENGLKTLTIDSFFPSKLYSWLGSVTLAPLCIDFFKRHRNKPLRIVIASLSIQENMECIITDFRYSKKHNGDIKYTLSIQEYINPNKIGGNSA
ncbi:hypothetical protein H3N56_03795 [Cetobacterium sp. 2A]|uniref:hypothetical protein n=1 Tax=unclassified Cetobacterium TaxID=2630983 RepID=UPI00163CA9AA|nr:hypothetical protein [Cetobacterium sp. 2A]MBC2855246.1 hypothetical protein [Cetobacterium sp. 2A]MBC2855294.1 hypothetical protein [Cetobacterium sp. 2A]MBC2855620.1 hypothetical protein [Cetobacterium sp. 2A]